MTNIGVTLSPDDANDQNSDISFAAPLQPGEVRVWCVWLNEDKELIERAYLNLTKKEQERTTEFSTSSARDGFVVSRGVLRGILATLCKMAPQEMELGYSENGKPYLVDSPQLKFNLSHSGNLAVYGVTTSGDLGVDVEVHRPMSDMELIARRFFAKSEHEELLEVPTSQREAAFFDCWVRKEAYVKALGGGLSIPLDSFRVSLSPGQPAALLSLNDHTKELHEWLLEAFYPAPGYSGAFAIRDRQCWLRLDTIRPATILVAQ